MFLDAGWQDYKTERDGNSLNSSGFYQTHHDSGMTVDTCKEFNLFFRNFLHR